jgi:hypothetical protein
MDAKCLAHSAWAETLNGVDEDQLGQMAPGDVIVLDHSPGLRRHVAEIGIALDASRLLAWPDADESGADRWTTSLGDASNQGMDACKPPSNPGTLTDVAALLSCPRACQRSVVLCAALFCLASLSAAGAPWAQQKASAAAVQAKVPVSKAEAPAVNAPDDVPLPGDWAPELLDGILSSSNAGARQALYDAAFAAGPGLIPQLKAALRDDRTAEFAAQCLAFLGGEKAMKILGTLVSDRRDLDLRRFYLGALGEYQDPEITRALLETVEKSDAEPDRTVTEAAIWSLSVRSDPSLPGQLQQAESKLEDFVIRDDVDNVRQVIATRARYLASPEGRKAGGSIPEAVRTYFIAALQNPPSTARKQAGGAGPQPPQAAPARAEVERVTFAPDSARALAHVTLSDSKSSANYDMVLQKELGDWQVVSVWMNSEAEKAEPKPAVKQQL